VHHHESSKVISGGKYISKVRFPLALVFNGIDDGSRIRASDYIEVVVELGEVLGQLQGKPLQMEDPLEAAKFRSMSCIVLPTWIEGSHNVMV
jgi:hypothetical protein